MNISSITSTNAASQLAGAGKIDGGSAAASRQALPPPEGEGGGFISAIADALKSIGVSGSESEAGADTSNAAQALGSFIEELMSALHAQGGDENSPPAYGEPAQGGPGKLAADLQGLIAKLGDSTETESAGSTSSTLESSFGTLLSALGADSGDAASQLGSFLQTLAGSMPEAHTSGKLINTTA